MPAAPRPSPGRRQATPKSTVSTLRELSLLLCVCASLLSTSRLSKPPTASLPPTIIWYSVRDSEIWLALVGVCFGNYRVSAYFHRRVPISSLFVSWWPNILKQRRASSAGQRLDEDFEIVLDRITDWKFDKNNYQQWKWVIEIYVARREKTIHLLVDPPTPMTDAWALEDTKLLYQVLTIMEPKIQDLILHCLTTKESWYFLCELYRRSNINIAYDVIQELFRKKQNGQPMYDHYNKFNRLAKELRQIFLIMPMWSACKTSGTGWWYWPTWVPSALLILRLDLKL